MWCYRSTKDLCCPIQQGIQARISRPWKGLWCICASGCLISANRKGLNGWPHPSADSPLCGATLAGHALSSAFWDLPPHPAGSTEYHRQLDLGQRQRCHIHLNILIFINAKLMALHYGILIKNAIKIISLILVFFLHLKNFTMKLVKC